MATPLEQLVQELNQKNNQTHPASDLTVAFQYDDTGAGKSVGKLSGSSTGSLSSAGSTSIRYNRIKLSDLFQSVEAPLRIISGNSVNTILPSLSRNHGIRLSTDDVVDAAISWTKNAATITITAAAKSSYFTGSVTLPAVKETIDLATHYATTQVNVSNVPVTASVLLQALNAANQVYVPLSAVTIEVVGADTSTSKNTRARITGIAGSGYVGSVDFFYDRRDLSYAASMSSLSVVDSTATGWDLIPYIVAAKGNIITTADVVNSTIDYSVLPSIYTLTASATSLTYQGSVNIDVRRRSDYKQLITVNLTANDTAYTTQKLIDAITPQVKDTAAPTDVVINVGQNILIVGAASATPTLVLDKYAGLTDLRYVINNKGSIYGRGGNGGTYTNGGQARAGFDGGDAIKIVDTTIEVRIDNQGRICGGGGGGAVENNSGVVGYGGGGAPFGVSSANATGTASETSYTTGTSSSSYPIQSNGGRGGDVGQNGGDGSQYFTSNGALGHTTPGGKAGNVVSGSLTKLTWVTKGLRLPFLADDVLPTGLSNATIGRTYPDPTNAKRLTVWIGTINNAGTSILSVANLSTAAGLTAGTAGSNTGWYVAYIDGKFVMFPVVPIRYGISYQQLYNLGLVDGDGTTGKNPPDGAALVTQRKLITYNSQSWSLRLFGGANVDPVGSGSSHIGNTTTDTVNSEWNRLFYNLAAEVFSGQPANKWASASDAVLATAYNSVSNGYALTKERHNFDGTDRRVTRGGGDSSTDSAGTGIKRIGSAPVATAAYQWRPVLELVV